MIQIHDALVKFFEDVFVSEFFKAWCKFVQGGMHASKQAFVPVKRVGQLRLLILLSFDGFRSYLKKKHAMRTQTRECEGGILWSGRVEVLQSVNIPDSVIDSDQSSANLLF